MKNKIPGVSSLVNNHNHDKYTTTSEFNTLTAYVFNARLAKSNWWQKQIMIILYQTLILNLQEMKQKMNLL